MRSSYNFCEIAKEVANVLARHEVPHNGVKLVFDALEEIIAHQVIQEVKPTQTSQTDIAETIDAAIVQALTSLAARDYIYIKEIVAPPNQINANRILAKTDD